MKKILIVEDEIAIAELEKDYLELSGFEVEVANDGKEGLNKALKEDFKDALDTYAKFKVDVYQFFETENQAITAFGQKHD